MPDEATAALIAAHLRLAQEMRRNADIAPSEEIRNCYLRLAQLYEEMAEHEGRLPKGRDGVE
jgi:hypothetical protein